MKAFEYKTLTIGSDDNAQDELNKLGLEGWELVCVQQVGFKLRHYLKRELVPVKKKKAEEKTEP